MAIELPKPIADYFATDSMEGPDAVAACFTADAVVVDEGNTYTGRTAIRDWKAGAGTKYTYTVEPYAIDAEGGRTVVTSRLEGNFPGSPVDLRYAFALEGDRIAGLEIAP
ncbi:nuclear transport factor 2 family protein [Oceanicella sp. SM1341]|uniref:nuclear transport factor 2 family protein n=1 Tax=Oceanicella sp. SM1341 TaxID=1548889 RepID=UPI000E51F3DC|nr:nuclear transport factor 2 family protein [Oceanicella sp. SM1341]